MLAIASGCAAPPRERVGPVVEPEALAQLLSRRPVEVKVFDVRDAAAYRKGHVEGAVWLDVKAWKDASFAAQTGLDHRQVWYGRIGEIGIDGQAPVVIYDDGSMTEAARIWFILQHFGVAEAGVVNGGYPAITPLFAKPRAAGGIVPAAASTPPSPVTFRPARGARAAVGLADTEAVRRAIEQGEVQVFDARTTGEYAGTDARGNPRAGHLPGAVNLSHKDLLESDGRLKPAAELAALLEGAGLKRGQPIIAHCQSGGRSSLAALAAAQAGFGPVRNYYLSFGEWSKDATCPVVTEKESAPARP